MAYDDDAHERAYHALQDQATGRRTHTLDILSNPSTDDVDEPEIHDIASEFYRFGPYQQPKKGKMMTAGVAGKDSAEKYLWKVELREYMRQLYVNLGLNEARGVPPYMNIDDIQRLEGYNRRSRANRLAGSGHMRAIPIDLYVYLWKNSVILKNMRHVFMLTRKDIARGMKLTVSAVSIGMSALESIGLIARVGTCKRGKNAHNIVYEFYDLDTFYDDHSLHVAPNYKIRERVADIHWNNQIKTGRKPKAVRKRADVIQHNPYWGLFTDLVGDVTDTPAE